MEYRHLFIGKRERGNVVKWEPCILFILLFLKLFYFSKNFLKSRNFSKNLNSFKLLKLLKIIIEILRVLPVTPGMVIGMFIVYPKSRQER